MDDDKRNPAWLQHAAEFPRCRIDIVDMLEHAERASIVKRIIGELEHTGIHHSHVDRLPFQMTAECTTETAVVRLVEQDCPHERLERTLPPVLTPDC